MHGSLVALVRKNYFLAALVSFIVLFGATITLADIFSGLSTTNSSTNVTSTNLTIARPSDVAQGDVMLANIAINDGNMPSVTPPSGWTQILRTDNDTSISIVSFWKVAGASEPSNYTWSLSPQTRAEGGITRYSGVDSSNPIDASAGNFGRGSVATASAITTTGSNHEVVAFFAAHVGANGLAGAYFSTPAGMTEKYDASFPTAGPSIAADDAVQASAGVAGSKSATISGPQKDWASQQIALRRAPVDCTGGTITHVDGNTIHTFAAVGTTTLNCTSAGAKTANILVVGGGGGGGANGGAGGGAGGYISNSTYSITADLHTVIVGVGGNGCATSFLPEGGTCDVTAISNGGNSQFDTQLAYGGGYGSSCLVPVTANSGGSGGGGTQCGTNGGAGAAGQGNAGGNGLTSGPNYPAGGGGGASAAGETPAGGSSNGGNGGAGYSNAISGSAVWYAGGGGAGRSDSGGPGIGGNGGGGNGGAQNTNGGDAVANTGGGGGGSGIAYPN